MVRGTFADCEGIAPSSHGARAPVRYSILIALTYCKLVQSRLAMCPWLSRLRNAGIVQYVALFQTLRAHLSDLTSIDRDRLCAFVIPYIRFI